MVTMRGTDHAGKMYGQLQAVRPLDQRDAKGQVIWECACACGSVINVAGPLLTRGDYQSCGCQRIKHGLCEHPLYVTWTLIRQRVDNPKCPAYRLYGGRGISYSARWNDFETFLSDVGQRPENPPGWVSRKPYWSIDRIDPDGNYEPSNIRWATPTEQNRNKSKVRA
jgi:hypothetical protein